jgi:hypothetical protein
VLPSSPFFEYQAHARAYLARAKDLLEKFDQDGNPTHLFYAAFELRTGIEARAWDYLRVALKRHNKKPEELKDYVASKLMRRLLEYDPDSDKEVLLRVTSDQTGNGTTLQYTPIPKRLGAIHGQLGDLLHYKFFLKNEYWNFKQPLEGKRGKSLADFRLLLGEGVQGLAKATSTLLLGAPKFDIWIDNEIDRADSDSPDSPDSP